mmetsp:Transcript_8526/g.14374  ORF Transcript_8526/g.14374 Transcript_8526/m.14374 type:complete len:107 (+) Transcript_8526:597-917(+)|eukprot:CAMPEP_0168621492 /NCGR_PEP_ID=MMETSP0449_2-20121227/7722_1 /TAXON_ID=1082188 /ORGANISM="Strombidium rassoulzadegani, Strain ras09" /LENGTH=106 /DNA_ID=CAMNT_0008662613 /DNA_START=519 /DNA_END=839 /DNA_ORIENTATION=-
MVQNLFVETDLVNNDNYFQPIVHLLDDNDDKSAMELSISRFLDKKNIVQVNIPEYISLQSKVAKNSCDLENRFGSQVSSLLKPSPFKSGPKVSSLAARRLKAGLAT